MKLDDLLSSLPAVRSVEKSRMSIRKRLAESDYYLAVVDDDPTGTQTVHGIRVYTDWSVKRLCSALGKKERVFYISTNSRSLNRNQAEELNYQLGRNLAEAARIEKVKLLLASRSDSTLRGHFPYEVDKLASGFGEEFDGVIIIPAFFEGGRYTVNDIHWVDQGESVVSADQTEYAQDPAFGYRSGNLKLWVEEKMNGVITADDIYSISLETIRCAGPEAVHDILMRLSGGIPVIVNAACYEDVEVFVLGLAAAEAQGKKFLYRCAASFVKVRGGFEDEPLLTYEELKPGKNPGLIVVGSYVEKTTRQLDCLLQSNLAVGVELQVTKLLDSGERDSEIDRLTGEVDVQLKQEKTVAVYTSRERNVAEDDDFLKIGEVIMNNLCHIVNQLKVKPGYVVAKGGITSIEVAKTALEVREALVLGQIAPGIPVWRLEEQSLWPDIPYVVFPGNVGGDGALVEVVVSLQK